MNDKTKPDDGEILNGAGATDESNTPATVEGAKPNPASPDKEPQTDDSIKWAHHGAPLASTANGIIDDMIAGGMTNSLHAYMTLKSRVEDITTGERVMPWFLKSLLQGRGYKFH